MQKDVVQKALAKAGTVKDLAKALDVQCQTIYRWAAGFPMTMASEAKLKEYVNAAKD
jgi:transposase-like protein